VPPFDLSIAGWGKRVYYTAHPCKSQHQCSGRVQRPIVHPFEPKRGHTITTDHRFRRFAVLHYIECIAQGNLNAWSGASWGEVRRCVIIRYPLKCRVCPRWLLHVVCEHCYNLYHNVSIIRNDSRFARFNTYRFANYKEQVITLLRRVCTVSVQTMQIAEQMTTVSSPSADTRD
jgi:hypothetical protein